MSKPIKVVISGIHGRMGKASARLVLEDPQLELVGAVGRRNAPYAGKDVGEIAQVSTTGILVSNSIEDLPASIQPDVLLDFSLAEAAYEYSKYALQHGFRPVVGTSGLGEDKIKSLSQLSQQHGVGALVVPNFSLGAVLMMEFARQAGQFFENVEIVEMHQPTKVDAPSGTAMHTTAKLDQSGKSYNQSAVKEHELIANARGGKTASGVRVHSLRLPGLISHQEVIFGSAGELLTIRHDSFNTDCFLNGIKMAVQAVMNLKTLVVGLDKIMSSSGEFQTVGGRNR